MFMGYFKIILINSNFSYYLISILVIIVFAGQWYMISIKYEYFSPKYFFLWRYMVGMEGTHDIMENFVFHFTSSL